MTLPRRDGKKLFEPEIAYDQMARKTFEYQRAECSLLEFPFSPFSSDDRAKFFYRFRSRLARPCFPFPRSPGQCFLDNGRRLDLTHGVHRTFAATTCPALVSSCYVLDEERRRLSVHILLRGRLCRTATPQQKTVKIKVGEGLAGYCPFHDFKQCFEVGSGVDGQQYYLAELALPQKRWEKRVANLLS